MQVIKLVVFTVFGLILWGSLFFLSNTFLWQDIIIVLMFILLLPPAANIIVLETSYRNKGNSVPLIASGTILSLGLFSILAIGLIFL